MTDGKTAPPRHPEFISGSQGRQKPAFGGKISNFNINPAMLKQVQHDEWKNRLGSLKILPANDFQPSLRTLAHTF